jgi:hypothetical protein
MPRRSLLIMSGPSWNLNPAIYPVYRTGKREGLVTTGDLENVLENGFSSVAVQTGGGVIVGRGGVLVIGTGALAVTTGFFDFFRPVRNWIENPDQFRRIWNRQKIIFDCLSYEERLTTSCQGRLGKISQMALVIGVCHF